MALWAFRIALIVTIALYVIVLLVGAMKLVDSNSALLASTAAAGAIGISALGCVVAQAVVIISRKRHVDHG